LTARQTSTQGSGDISGASGNTSGGGGSGIPGTGNQAGGGRNITSEDVSKLYNFQSLPLMERATGRIDSKTLLDEILEDERKEQGSNDYGCICEIDLT